MNKSGVLAPSSFVKIFFNLLVVLFSLSCIFPVLWIINSSFRTNEDFMGSIVGLALNPSYANYSFAFSRTPLGTYFTNSVVVSVISVTFCILFSFFVGYFVARYRFRGRNLIYLMFLSGMIVPSLALLVPLFMEFKLIGLLDKRYTLFLPYIAFNMPMAVILMEGFIRGIPYEIEEAAYMEGCTTTDLLFKIIFPLSMPIVATNVIIAFMNIWNEFPFALTLLRSEHLRTISVGLRMFGSEYTINYTMIMTALVIATMPVIIIYLLFYKRIIEGMTLGAVKG
jgi:raffinose/stachyose/melibiose transport system permease protein